MRTIKNAAWVIGLIATLITLAAYYDGVEKVDREVALNFIQSMRK